MTIEICGKILGQYSRQRLPSENLHHGRNLSANEEEVTKFDTVYKVKF